MKAAWLVYRKELLDALRDRRTLMMVLLSSVVLGPALLVALSMLVGQMERRAEQREVMVAGLAHAPTLENYLRRQTFTVKPAPADYERQLKASRLGDPVVVVPPDFEAALQRGEAPLLEVVVSSANQRSQNAAGRVHRLLQGFSSEQATLRLASRGVSPQVAQVLQVESRDLANPQTRAAQLTGMLPFFVLMAVLYGALHAALDTTAGERERGSLEPLLTNPASRAALVLGKWGAVASLGLLIALLSSFSFLPGQWLLRSETLQALFQYGPREALLFLLLLAPLAAAVSALMMAIAIRCKSFKEAQANNTVLMLAASLLPIVTLFNQEGEQPWHLWVPALAQTTLMNRVLRGEALGVMDVLVPLWVSALVAAAGIVFVARQLRTIALK
jgi:sodium transport system permease protein